MTETRNPDAPSADGLRPSLFVVLYLTMMVITAAPARAQTDCVNIGNACDPSPAPCTEEGTLTCPDLGCCLELNSICDATLCNPGACDLISCCTGDPTCCDANCCTVNQCPPVACQSVCADESELCCPCEGLTMFPDAVNPLRALTDLSDPAFRYQNTHALGLYVNSTSNPTVQTNDITLIGTHFTSGLAQSAEIVPLDAAGVVNHATGKIGVVSIGFSNVFQEFQDFLDDLITCVENPSDPLCPGNSSNFDGLNHSLVIVNGGKPGNAACEWIEEPIPAQSTNIWGELVQSKLLLGKAPGQDSGFTALTPEQVQVVWMKMVLDHPWDYCTTSNGAEPCCNNCCGDPAPGGACSGESCGVCGQPNCFFPNYVEEPTNGEAAKIKKILEHVRFTFPNVKLVFLTSRGYGGYGNEGDTTDFEVPQPCSPGSPEPHAFENGLAIQNIIKAQAFDGQLAFGALDLHPYVAWGPYIWANGVIPNPDGLTWLCHQICADGSHPSRDADAPGLVSGQSQVGLLLYSFFKTHALTVGWFLEKPVVASTFRDDGFVDPLEDLDVTPVGLMVVNFEFDKPVFDQTTGSSDLSDSFVVTSTGSNPPDVFSVQNLGSNRFAVTLSQPIEPGQWTTIRAVVKDVDGNPIRTDPWDRVDIGFLPGDVNNNGVSNAQDVNILQSCLVNSTCSSDPANLPRMDIDRDGDLDSADRTRLQQLLTGVNTTRVDGWNGATLPPKP